MAHGLLYFCTVYASPKRPSKSSHICVTFPGDATNVRVDPYNHMITYTGMYIDMSIIRTTRLLSLFSKYFVNVIKRNNFNPVDLAYLKFENPNTKNNLPPLFVMHGLLGSKKNWQSTCKAMVAKIHKREIYVPDARNHGESPHTEDHRYEDMVADILQLMKKENIPKIALLGHSMGGKCMMYMALKYPHLVEKAIFIDVTPNSKSESLNNLGVILSALKQIKISPKVRMPCAIGQADQQLQLLNYPDGRYGWQVNVEALDKSFAKDIAKFPADAHNLKYKGPTLFVGGSDEDSIDDQKLALIREEYFPEARLIVIPAAGHLVHIQQQSLLIGIVVSFLYDG